MPPVMIAVRVLAGELLRHRRWVRMRRAVGIAFERDRRHGDHRACREPLFQLVILRLALGQAEPPAIVVDDDIDVIGVVERRGAAIERRVVEAPFRRRGLPDQLRELVPVLLVAGAAALRREVELIPPLQLGLRRQRRLVRPPGCRSGSRSPRPSPCSAPATAPRRCSAVRAPQSKPATIALSIFSASMKRDDVERRPPTAVRCEECRRTESASSRSRAATARSRGSPCRQQGRDVDEGVDVIGHPCRRMTAGPPAGPASA